MKNIESERQRARDKEFKLRLEVINAYGGKCECCGEKEIAFLCLDHNGGRYKSPKLTKIGCGTREYRAVKKLNFPKIKFRILCANCNQAVSHGRICPHKSKKKK